MTQHDPRLEDETSDPALRLAQLPVEPEMVRGVDGSSASESPLQHPDVDDGEEPSAPR